MAADVHAGAPHSSSRQKTINWCMRCTFDRIGGNVNSKTLGQQITQAKQMSMHAVQNSVPYK